MTTKQEYIESLTTKQLRKLLDIFTSMLIDQDELNYLVKMRKMKKLAFSVLIVVAHILNKGSDSDEYIRNRST